MQGVTSLIVGITLGGALVLYRYHLNGRLVHSGRQRDASMLKACEAVTELEAATSEVLKRSSSVVFTDGSGDSSSVIEIRTIAQAHHSLDG